MKPTAWLRDTIARRFAATVFAAAIIAFDFGRLLTAFGNSALRLLDEHDLRGVTAGIIRAMDSAPPQSRQAIAAAAPFDPIHVEVYDAASPVAAALKEANDVDDGRELMGYLLGDKYRRVVLFKPSSRIATLPALNYDRARYPGALFLGAELTDGSRVVFSAMNFSGMNTAWGLWGFGRRTRWLIVLLILTITTVIVSTIAARQLGRPVKRLAEAVGRFGVDPRAPAIPEAGPEELRQVIRTFNGMQAQIQRFVAHRTTMLAAISHDLRTPLTRIRLRGEFIADEVEQERLFRDVDEMQTMVDGALAFFRDDAVEEAMTTFDLPGVLRTIANDYADQGIDIAYSGPSRAVYRGRPFALKRAFTNLIDNAIKYGTPPQIQLCDSLRGYVIRVSDRGPGIPEHALERVFTPYFRLDKSRNRTTGGVGLGLSVAQSIIRGHGGEIILENRPGGGLEARVTLPVAVLPGHDCPAEATRVEA
ncbi:MAG TPA: ATP-binding protein [Xanthobacteraceae bacterium]|jgi:signal transduction histidine kinase|nr:ATP-binding protein [Xanthobacteraceae bacterium]